MQQLMHYVTVGQKTLRCGYTTGTCAAAATRAATCLLLEGEAPAAVAVETPAGITATIEVEEIQRGEDWASAAVRKDSGDDPDVTNGVMVFSRVTRMDGSGITIDGGEGVGRVTREGLDQPPGEAAINSTPRAMIAAEAQSVAESVGYAQGLHIEISIPAGVELARKTFNPRLGIEGGISILGTSGIVKPMSEDALIASIQLELRMKKAQGVRRLLICPGNYGSDFARDELRIDLDDGVQCSNYLGATLDYACQLEFESVLLVAHIGKLIKVAAGVMNTHSRVADARLETMAAHAACCGAPTELVRSVMGSVTTDEAIDYLNDAHLLEPTMDSVMRSAERHLKRRVSDAMRIEAVTFSKVHGLLGKTSDADSLLALHAQ